MSVRLRTFGAAGVLMMAFVATGTLAHAQTGVPAVGDCYQVTNQQTYDDYWAPSAAVPCAGPHSIQITKSSVLPADVNAVTFAQDHCEYAEVWTDAGVNQALEGIVARPLRLDAFYFVVREPGVTASYVCGIGAVEQRGSHDEVLVSMRGAVADLSAAAKARLQFCSKAVKGAPLAAKAITVPCTTTPRWQVTRWIMWDDLYAAYPGEGVLRARAARLCGSRAVASVPSAEAWPGGTHRSWCYVKHA